MAKSKVEKFKALRERLFDNFQAAAITIQRSRKIVLSAADRAAGKSTKGTETETLHTRGFASTRNVKAVDGTLVQQSIISAEIALMVDDKITIGDKIFTVSTVDDVCPDGKTNNAIIFRAVVL